MIVSEMSGQKTPDYYAALCISETATDADIRRQYRLLSKQHHPDMGGSHEAMATINEAYGVLSDTFKRSLYDAERRRALHVPSRQPEQPVYTPPRRQPAPRAQPQFMSRPPKRRGNWWTRLAWGFAVTVVVVGVLAQLPIAQSSATSDPQPVASQPLSVTYPSDSSPAATPTTTFYTAPDGTSYSTPSDDTQASSQSETPQNTTCSTHSTTSDCYSTSTGQTCNDDNCQTQQTQSDKNCVTKTYGLYRHVTCTSPNGSNNCTNNTVGNSRYTICK